MIPTENFVEVADEADSDSRTFDLPMAFRQVRSKHPHIRSIMVEGGERVIRHLLAEEHTKNTYPDSESGLAAKSVDQKILTIVPRYYTDSSDSKNTKSEDAPSESIREQTQYVKVRHTGEIPMDECVATGGGDFILVSRTRSKSQYSTKS